MPWQDAGPDDCDGIGDCGACFSGECAADICATELDECFANQECLELNACWNSCPADDTACFAECNALYRNGVEDLYATYACLYCQACPMDCDGANSGYCQ